MGKNNRYIRNQAPANIKKTAEKAHIVPIQLQRIRQDVSTRRDAIAEAERAYWPYRYKMQQMFLNTKDNGHISACIERRKDLTMLRKFEILNPAGEVDEKTSLLFCYKRKDKLIPKTWFLNFISHSLDALFYGYSLIHLGDIYNGDFKELKVVKRWNVSPDRCEVTSFPYNPNGVKFLEDPQFKDWYVYIDTPNEFGVSPCGYGLLWEVSIAEIFLRNLLGFNGDFVEMFAQPYRVLKSIKTNEEERAEQEAMLQNMGSAGWAIIDPTDELSFLETSLGGTGYKGYDNLELRLHKIISKLILGHEDAISSIPGKLGNNGEESPAQQALEDKQSKDGMMIESIVQDMLFEKMRALGFNIPEGTTFGYKNDAEVMENATKYTELAKSMKSAGLQMPAQHFTEKTGIPAESAMPAPVPMTGKKPAQFSKNVINKLNEFYA